MKSMKDICALAPVIPVLVIEDVEHAVKTAETLVDAGLPVLEVTLRTAAALDVIRAMSSVEGAVVGAGTVLNAKDIESTRKAGATFAVSPGATDSLLDAAEAYGMPVLPGAITPSGIMQLLDRGYDLLKFFPAEAAGGVAMLKSLGGPFPQVQFCPTGGINLGNVAEYLSQPNVVCVGGSWIVTKERLQTQDWQAIHADASAAARR